MLYYCGWGELDGACLLASNLLSSVSSIVGGLGGLDNAWFFVATFPFPFTVSIFSVVDDPFLTLSVCVGEIGKITKELLTLCGKKYGSLIFNPVCPAFL